ncbi:hypothetical protein F5883DRAFT_647807 [Diaporthe sp. PMI_573]|nr:hypothetical protein F5883DRAFT_647807 [Diaporthaceae sp. PMI_573]
MSGKSFIAFATGQDASPEVNDGHGGYIDMDPHEPRCDDEEEEKEEKEDDDDGGDVEDGDGEEDESESEDISPAWWAWWAGVGLAHTQEWMEFGRRCLSDRDLMFEIACHVEEDSTIYLRPTIDPGRLRKKVRMLFSKANVKFECVGVEVTAGPRGYGEVHIVYMKKNPGGIPDGPEYNYSTIESIETATFGTGRYDQSLTEAVLESLDFNTQQMRKMIAKPDAIKFNTQVTAIESNIEINSTVTAEITVKTKDTTTHKPMHDGNYLTVLNSTTLGSMNRMDLSKTGLFWDTKQAIRCLGYGASCKGGLAHTDFPLQVCVYPSYNVDDPVNEPIVLLVSYTWGQTAQRLASLIPSCNDDSSAQEELRNVLIHDLTLLTAQGPTDAESYKVTRERIAGDLVETHGYDWYRDPHMAGVFAFFGPCQFWDLQLYFIGEAASGHQAWIVGALESVVRAVWLMLDCLHQGSKKDGRGGVDSNKGFAPYEKATKLLQDGPAGTPEFPLSSYPLPMELPKRCKDEEKRPADQLVDHPQLDKTGAEVPIKYGAAVVALSMVDSESTLNEWAQPEVKFRF